jgi:hypothetical protein
LIYGNQFNAGLNAQVTARYHDAVRCRDDFIKMLDSFGLLDLGHKGSVSTRFSNHLFCPFAIAGTADERQSNVISFLTNGPLQVSNIFLGK